MTRTYVRVAKVSDSPQFADICARISVEKRPPESVGALTGGLTNAHVEDVVAVIDSTQDRRQIAGEFLSRARDDFERAARTRVAYIANARRYGMTNAEIGGLLGITEGAVRYIVKHHGAA